jgi:hypothetical protein
MDRISEPFRSAERIRDDLRNDRILVVSRIADKGPAVAKSLAEKVRQIAGASVGDPSLLRDGLTYRERIPARGQLPRRANDSP